MIKQTKFSDQRGQPSRGRLDGGWCSERRTAAKVQSKFLKSGTNLSGYERAHQECNDRRARAIRIYYGKEWYRWHPMEKPYDRPKNLWAVKAPIRATLSGSFRIRPHGYDTCLQRAICAGLDVLQRRPYFTDSQFQSKLLGIN